MLDKQTAVQQNPFNMGKKGGGKKDWLSHPKKRTSIPGILMW